MAANTADRDDDWLDLCWRPHRPWRDGEPDQHRSPRREEGEYRTEPNLPVKVAAEGGSAAGPRRRASPLGCRDAGA